jgi:SAM-dependent methyltransferase
VTADAPDRHYLLGHSEHELARLDLQGRLYREVTLRAFRDGGLVEGMSVLDIGCGSGDVSLTAAEVVGADGRVLGIVRGTDAVATATRKAEAAGVDRVGFERVELDDFRRRGAFDAIVGRFILMHQPDPAAALRSLCVSARPGAPVVIVESWMEVLRTGAHSFPHSLLYDEIVGWKSAVVSGAGADLHAGGRLRATFLEAGLPDPETRLEALVAGGPDSLYWEYVEQSVRSMLPEARRLGIGGFDEDSVAGLGARLRDEVVARHGSVLAWPVVAAWSRVPRRASTGE